MATLKAVIGANYGDEGKGKMTDYLASKAIGRTIVVCSNGGSQRGHSVFTKKGEEHIFSHFGSGTFAGADTYLSKKYVLNPIIFAKERKELFKKYKFLVYVNPECLCSTPFDMISNQLIELNRGSNKHGSCGVGIWETILRNGATLGDMLKMSNDDMRVYLKGVRDSYFLNNRLKSKKANIDNTWSKIYFSDNLIENYIKDFKYMVQNIKLSYDNVIKNYDNVIFENGQGLLLDENISKDPVHSTPSNTGCKNIKEIIKNVYGDDYKIEVCFVTRSYITRHGCGEFAGENDSMTHLWPIKIEDETNKYNVNQGKFRYGVISLNDMYNRCVNDFYSNFDDLHGSISFAVTHCDEYTYSFLCNNEFVDNITSNGIKIYYSDSKYREDTMEVKHERLP